ncbi:MAG TPA: SusC/RagA family TonB-linked outer membrane protein [Bacteroidales bacterium]|nr:SusC/RagA family TonB-linked outer membrane protein [Bacteroidales bacterium]
MKLSIFLLYITIFSVFGSKTYSQNTRLDLDMKDVPIQTILNSIENQSEFFFLYSTKMIDVTQKVDINVSKKLLPNILDELLADTEIKYVIRNRQVMLVNKDAEASLELQEKQVTGTVSDIDQQPVVGANVVVKGTQIGVITDIDGKFTIDVPSSAGTFVFSFIGYTPQEILIGTSTVINVTLQMESTSLNEVVIVGYGTVLKRNISTSVSKVSVADVPKAASSNMTQLLVGRAAGLQSTVASAQPGGNVNISIRGAGAPIYIIDGIVMPNISLDATGSGFVGNVNRGALSGLNPEDIESVEILKDASVSIYGIGASQGVILVTTKRSKQGPIKLSYDGSYSVVKNNKYLDILNSQEYMGLVNVFNKEQYLYLNNLAPYGPTAYTSGWTAPFDAATIADAETTDWKNLVLRDGSIENHNLTVSGGSEFITYYMSGNYFKQIGSVSNSSLERYSIRSNVVMQVQPFLKITSIINANRNTYNNSAVGGTSGWAGGAQGGGALINALTYPPQIPLFDANGVYSVFKNIPNAVSMEDMLDKTFTNGIYLNFAADFTIIKNMLTAKLLFGDNLEKARHTSYVPIDVYFGQIYQSRGNLGEDSQENQTLEATIAFNKEFGSFLNFDAVIGAGKYYYKSNGMNVRYQDQYDAIANDDLSTIAGTISPGSYISLDEKRSQFVRLNFDFLDRFVINSTLRRDGTDKFFPDKKYSLFPSVSTAWKIFNESFMKNVAWINMLKIRASIGITGSDNLGTILYGTYGPATNYVFFNQNALKYIPIVTNGLDYPNVSWEKTTMKNIGLDFALFKDRIFGSFDMFRNDITDMLGDANTAGLSMFGTYPINGGHLRREGWDANLNTKNIQNLNFSWTSILNLTRYNSLWIERFPGYDYLPYEKKGVAPSNARYFYETNGIINADMSNMPESQPAGTQIPGYPIIADLNGDGTITIDDIKMTNEVPKIYFGLGNTFTYKNFDMDIFMYSQLGVNKINYAWSWMSASGLANESSNQNSYSFDIWNSQTNPNGTRPGIAYGLASVPLPGGAGTDLSYQNASFVRVRNISLGYTFTSKILGDASVLTN